MKTRLAARFIVGALGAVLALSAVGAVGKESYFTCKGSIGVHGSSLPVTQERQEIAAHIKDRKILFSGNSLLGGGDGIQICPAKTLGTSPDEYYFDSDSCSGKHVASTDRRYGTYNPITRRLNLSEEKHVADVWLVEGTFACTPVKVSDE